VALIAAVFGVNPRLSSSRCFAKLRDNPDTNREPFAVSLPRHLESTSRRLSHIAAILLLLVSINGCAVWNKDRWNPARYRDERAVDIEKRLERSEPIVKNPF
jgi:hypothetical protein